MTTCESCKNLRKKRNLYWCRYRKLSNDIMTSWKAVTAHKKFKKAHDCIEYDCMEDV